METIDEEEGGITIACARTSKSAARFSLCFLLPVMRNVKKGDIVDLIIKITFYSSIFLGALLLLVAAGNQIYRKESPISFLFVGLALLALPLASKIKVGPEGAELEIRTEIAAVEASSDPVLSYRQLLLDEGVDEDRIVELDGRS